MGFALAAGIFAAVEGWRAFGGDPGPKRWKTVAEFETPCYVNLTFQPLWAKVFDMVWRQPCVHNENAPIPQRSRDWIAAHVAVYTTAADPHSPPTLHDLGDRGQAEAIDYLALKSNGWADLKEALDDSQSGAGERDPFRFDRALIANVAKGVDWRPGDRMMWSRVLVQPINFKFAGYSVAETDNETQKVSSVERTDSRKLSPEIDAAIPAVEGPKVTLGASSERDVKTSSDISAQYEKLGIDVTPDFLRIMRESERGLDGVGNTRVPLTLVTDPEMIWKQYPEEEMIWKQHPEGKEAALRHAPRDPIVLLVTHFDGDRVDKQSDGDHPQPAMDDKPAKDAKPAKLAIDILPQTPVPHCALRARVWMIYEQRRVEGGRESYDESNQDVTLAHDAEDKQDVQIMSADEVSPAVWSLRLCQDAQCSGKDVYPLKATLKAAPVTQNSSLWRKVVFTDYGVAVRLAHWLRMHHTNTAPDTDYRFNYPYEFNSPYDVGRRYVTLAPYKTKDEECKAGGRGNLAAAD